MQCVNHPAVAPTALCTRCDAMLCGDCVEERRGKKFCANCAAYLDQRDQTRQIPVQPPNAPMGDSYQDSPPVAPPAASSVFPAPVSPAPVSPAPVSPAPVSPAPLSPAPAGPAPVSPGPVNPGPVNPVAAAPPAGAYPSPPPARAPPAPPPGEVYQGSGDTYQGPEDVYQGPPGDVYQDPTSASYQDGPPVAPSPVAASPGAIPDQANMMRAAIFGVVAAVMSTGIWYALAAASGRQRIFTVMLVGFAIGFATSWGAGRRGDMQVVGLSVGLYFASMIIGQFMINNYFHKLIYQELSTYEEESSGIVDDGDYSPEEARVLIGFSQEEWDEMSGGQQQFWIASLEAEYEEAIEEGWDPSEAAEEEDFEMTPTLPIDEFLTHLPGYFGIWGMICFVFGAVQAYKFPAGFDEE